MKHCLWLCALIIFVLGFQGADSVDVSQVKDNIMLIDASAHCGNTFTPPMVCPHGTEWYSGMCVKKCPAEHFRTGLCTCETGKMIWDCDVYAPRESEDCAEDEENVGVNACQKKCPDNMERAGRCGCGEAKAFDDCNLYGAVGTPTCAEGLELFMGVCMEKSCPDGWRRASCSTCFKLETTKPKTEKKALQPTPKTEPVSTKREATSVAKEEKGEDRDTFADYRGDKGKEWPLKTKENDRTSVKEEETHLGSDLKDEL